VEFDINWLWNRSAAHSHLQKFSHQQHCEMRYLLMMLRANAYGGLSKSASHFVAGMWPTESGAIDAVVRQIARWWVDDGGVCKSVSKKDETFGSLGSGVFRIELECRLEQGRYLRDPDVDFERVDYSHA